MNAERDVHLSTSYDNKGNGYRHFLAMPVLDIFHIYFLESLTSFINGALAISPSHWLSEGKPVFQVVDTTPTTSDLFAYLIRF